MLSLHTSQFTTIYWSIDEIKDVSNIICSNIKVNVDFNSKEDVYKYIKMKYNIKNLNTNDDVISFSREETLFQDKVTDYAMYQWGVGNIPLQKVIYEFRIK